MGTVRFVHCADLHLDTPFRGLANVAPDIGKALNAATFQSWTSIVDLAIAERVDFVVVAGDVYDSSDRSLRAQFRFRDGLKRLAEHGIPSFVTYGNHDPVSGWSNTLDWPESVHRFGAGDVESCPVMRDGATIATVHGISYAKEAVTENLSRRFERPDPSIPSVAVLHANVGGDAAHLPYAPTTVEELSSKCFTYWALGHVHAHRILKSDGPAIVYPGCSQSRQPNETGPKGCCLVTLADGGAPDVRFVPTDVVRFHQGSVDVSACESLDAVCRLLVEQCSAVLQNAQGRSAVARLTLTGRSTLHRELVRPGALDALLQTVRQELEGLEPWLWPEKLPLKTRASYNIDAQRGREDFVGDLMSVYDTLLDSASCRLEERVKELDETLSSWQGYRFLRDKPAEAVMTADEFAGIADDARTMTLDQLVEED